MQRFTFVVFAASVFCLTSAHAAGPYLADVDSVAQGQAGAYIASPSTLSAFWYNPAALASQDGLRFQVEGGLQYTPLDYQRANNNGQTYPLVTNQQPLTPAGFAALTYDFGIKNFAAGIAVYTPVVGNYIFPDRGPQRYQTVFSSSKLIHAHLGAAYKPLRWLSIGATVGSTYFSTNQRVTVSGALSAQTAEDPQLAVPLDVSVFDPVTFTANVGIRFEPTERLAIGFSLTPPFDIKARGTLKVSLPEALQAAKIDGDTLVVDYHFPITMRAGIRYSFDRVSIEAAMTWEQWSRNRTITLTPENVQVKFAPIYDQQLSAITVNKGYVDTFSARLGVQGRPTDWLTVRGGLAYESSATAPSIFDISSPDSNKLILAAGLSFALGRFSLDAAYSFIYTPPLTVDDSSQIKPITLLVPKEETQSIGQGVYTFSAHIIHVGIRGDFFTRSSK